MDSINLIKALYHFFAVVIHIYLSLTISTNLIIHYSIIIITLVHLYDTWWFLHKIN
jgi:hypothetical protein